MVQTLVPQANPFEVDQIVNFAGGASLFIGCATRCAMANSAAIAPVQPGRGLAECP